MSEKNVNEYSFGKIVLLIAIITLLIGIGFWLEDFSEKLNFPTKINLEVLLGSILLLPMGLAGYEPTWFGGFALTKEKKKEVQKLKEQKKPAPNFSLSSMAVAGTLMLILTAVMGIITLYLTQFFIVTFNVSHIKTFTFISFFLLPNLIYILLFLLFLWFILLLDKTNH